MNPIYCLEDDESIRDMVVYALKSAGIEARGFPDAARLYAAIAQRRPALVLLDVMLPGEDGASVLRRLKADPATSDIPAIMLTARSAEYDKVVALDGGADDYVTKPFGVMELISRVKAVLRRAGAPQQDGEAALSVGGVVLDPRRHVVTAGGQAVALTLKEFELLRHLMRNRGIVLTREKLLYLVWDMDFDSETRTVDVHVKSLRQKLGEYGAIVRTVRGVGYKAEEERA